MGSREFRRAVRGQLVEPLWRRIPGILEWTPSTASMDSSGNIQQVDELQGLAPPLVFCGTNRAQIRSGVSAYGYRDAVKLVAAQQTLYSIDPRLNLKKPYMVANIYAIRAIGANGRCLNGYGVNWLNGQLGTNNHNFFDNAQFVSQLDGTAQAGVPIVSIALSGESNFNGVSTSRHIRNGVDVTRAGLTGVSADPLGFYLGGQSLGVEHSDCDWLGLLVLPRVPTPVEIALVTEGAAQWWSLTGTQRVTERTMLNDRGLIWDTRSGDYIAKEHVLYSSLSRVKFKVKPGVTSVKVYGASSDNSGVQPPTHPFGTYNELAYFKDGVFQSTAEFVADSATRLAHDIALDGAEHTIEIVSGIQDLLNKGTTPICVDAPIGGVEVVYPVKPNRRIVITGDSISIAVYSEQPAKDGWVPLLRAAHPDVGISLESYGGRSLYVESGGALPAFVSHLAELLADVAEGGAQDLVVCLGTNDHGNYSNAATYLTEAQAFITAIRAAVPTLRHIYWNTIWPKNSTGTNAFGSTMADFNAAIATLTSLGVIVIDTSTFGLTAGMRPDGLHYDNTGNSLIAAGMATALGL